VIGFAGGPIPRIPLNLPLLKGCSIVGVYRGSFAVREPEVQGRNVAALWEHFETGRLAPVIGEVHPLQDFRAAFEALEQRRAMGKVVVTVAG
jgi:NADPH2:quinone reductase